MLANKTKTEKRMVILLVVIAIGNLIMNIIAIVNLIMKIESKALFETIGEFFLWVLPYILIEILVATVLILMIRKE